MNRPPKVRVRETELGDGSVLRAATIRRRRGEAGLILERVTDGDGAFGVLDPSDERLTLPASAVDDLRNLLDRLEN